MFTDKAQSVIDRAKDYSFSCGLAELGLPALLTVMSIDAEAGVLLAECVGMTPQRLRDVCVPEFPQSVACPSKMPLSESIRKMLELAKGLAKEVPDRFHPGLVNLRHLACAMTMLPEVVTILNTTPKAHEDALTILVSWYEREIESPRLDELTERLRLMRTELLTKVFGQDHAIHAVVEGLFNAEVTATADTKRRAPRAIFVFAGPPGVGKTLLAELGASLLARQGGLAL